MRLRFLHAADLHLDSPLRGLSRYEGAPVEEVRAATRRAFDQLVQRALGASRKERADCVLIAGDLYDGDWNDYNTGLYFTSAVSRLAEEGVDVLIVRGNHDAASRMTRALRLPPRVRMLREDRPETVVLEHLGVAVHGQSFAAGAIDEDLTPAYPAAIPGLFNIGLLHTSLNGRAGHDRYAPTDAASLRRKGYDYWALGHVHTAEIVSRDPWIVFPGNTQGRSIRETGGRGCSMVTVADGAIDHHFVPLDVVRWEHLSLDIGPLASLDDLFDRAQAAVREQVQRAEGRALALRLSLRGRSELQRRIAARPQLVEAELRSLAISVSGGSVWIEKVRNEARDPIDVERLLERDDPLGLLVRELRALADDEEALRELVRQVLVEVHGRLPAELTAGDGELRLDDPAQLRELLAEVEGDLLERLAGGGQSA